MIALGGVIGTGLFLGSGFTISQAGPLGAIAAYIIGGFFTKHSGSANHNK